MTGDLRHFSDLRRIARQHGARVVLMYCDGTMIVEGWTARGPVRAELPSTEPALRQWLAALE